MYTTKISEKSHIAIVDVQTYAIYYYIINSRRKNMCSDFLYIAQNTTDRKAVKHHIYKVGYSKDPEKRVSMLSGSASTDVYRLVFKIKLPIDF